jgi:hypothetical protein
VARRRPQDAEHLAPKGVPSAARAADTPQPAGAAAGDSPALRGEDCGTSSAAASRRLRGAPRPARPGAPRKIPGTGRRKPQPTSPGCGQQQQGRARRAPAQQHGQPAPPPCPATGPATASVGAPSRCFQYARGENIRKSERP